ncbi:Alpha/beta hydrolase family protein [Streptomyces sp. ADI92-24]|uniref:alpha/beta fold hydrolase n=1 Tax=unclassified Streptomyces TaxID=2593676 RepID=UPI000FB428C4|nr:alpha/beta hydrolase [Streptomyces sp. NBC_01260]RPK34805.1 Alpha/beta hydrolase family protein [Streptomyces sp. ADI92-24]
MLISNRPGPGLRSLSRSRRGYALAAALTAAVCGAAAPAAAGMASPTAPGEDGGVRPTVVLVHGAFADASSWNGVAERLQRRGYTVVAPANPLRGLAVDSASTAEVLRRIAGPIVLVGHAYGGAVISSAAAGNPQVRSLVYISAFMPDRGEALGPLGSRFPGSELGTALRRMPVRNADGGQGTDLYIQDSKFHDIAAADRPTASAAVMAASQRPVSTSVFEEKATAAAWRTLPSWVLVAGRDKVIAPDLERFQARRAHAHTIEVNSSHMAMVSRPETVTRLILAAAGDPSTADGPLASTGARTLVLAVIGSAAGLTVFVGGGLVAAARVRSGFGR